MPINRSGITPIILPPGGGETMATVGPTLTFKTVGKQSNGQYLVMEGIEPPGSASPPQWHKVTTVIVYVLEGMPTLQVGDETHQVGPGGYAYVPPGTVHAIANQSDAPVRSLWIMSPAGMENYMAEAMELVANEPSWPPADMSRLIALRRKHDTFDPPVG